MLFRPHRGSNTPVVGVRVNSAVIVSGAVPAGAGPGGLETRRS